MPERPIEPPAAAAEKRGHVFTLRVSRQLAVRVKERAKIEEASVNQLLTHYVWQGLRPARRGLDQRR